MTYLQPISQKCIDKNPQSTPVMGLTGFPIAQDSKHSSIRLFGVYFAKTTTYRWHK